MMRRGVGVVVAVLVLGAAVGGYFGAKALWGHEGVKTANSPSTTATSQADGAGTAITSTSVPPNTTAALASTTTTAASSGVTVAAPNGTSTTAPGVAPGTGPLLKAAHTVDTAVILGDSLGRCAFDPLQPVLDAIPASVPLAADLKQSAVASDEGQVFSGGDVDITYCDMSASTDDAGPVNSVRIDIAADAHVHFDTYLFEEYSGWKDDDFTLQTNVLGGWLRHGCFSNGTNDFFCLAAWQGDGLFISTVLNGRAALHPGDEVDTAMAVIPVVAKNLAASDLTCPSFKPACRSAVTSEPSTTKPAVGTPVSSGPSLPLAAAAATVHRSFDFKDSVPECPFQPLAPLLDAMPADLGLTQDDRDGALRADEGSTNEYGTLDVLTCPFTLLSGNGPVESMNIDVVAGAKVDVGSYLKAAYDGLPADFLAPQPDYLGGTLSAGCTMNSSNEHVCVAVWQADGLFIGFELSATDPLPASVEQDTAKAAIPIIVTNLANSTLECVSDCSGS